MNVLDRHDEHAMTACLCQARNEEAIQISKCLASTHKKAYQIGRPFY